jgi:hypothetical protein
MKGEGIAGQSDLTFQEELSSLQNRKLNADGAGCRLHVLNLVGMGNVCSRVVSYDQDSHSEDGELSLTFLQTLP